PERRERTRRGRSRHRRPATGRRRLPSDCCLPVFCSLTRFSFMPTATPPRRRAPTRDSLTTVADDGSRVFLHPADVRGRFTFWRRITAVLLIAVYAALPWIPINGHPAVFLDVERLRFHL